MSFFFLLYHRLAEKRISSNLSSSSRTQRIVLSFWTASCKYPLLIFFFFSQLLLNCHLSLFSLNFFAFQVKQYRDFIALLPEPLALHILSFLVPKELLFVCQVWLTIIGSFSYFANIMVQLSLNVLFFTKMRYGHFKQLSYYVGQCESIVPRSRPGKS